MNRYRLIASLLCLVLTAPVHARIDAMQLRLLEAYNQDLRWDNIESMPEWINGVKPYYSKDWQMHRVLLAPRQQTTVLLPAYQSLRLYHPKQTLNGTTLDVYSSNGTGLAVKQSLQGSTDGHSLVLSPNSAAPLLVHVARPESQTGDLEVALFVSRKVPLNDIAPYRNLIWLSARQCLLGQQPFVLPELYNQLSAQEKQELQVTGPVRLALKNRLHYEQHAGELIQDYRLRYWLDDHEAEQLDFSTSVETGRIVTVNTAIQIVGREEQAYLEIPQGQHKLVLQPDRPLYLQILAQTERDYLFGTLNEPSLPVEEIRKRNLLPSTELKQQEQKAKGIARDNSHQSGGMVAANLLREAALQRKDYPAGLIEAEQLRGFRTFYRDWLPSKKTAETAQFMAYFLAESLHAVNRPQSDAILADQHLAEALKRINNAYFTGIANAANEYALPEQQTAGSLRLIVDKRDCVPRRLYIEINRQTAQEVRLSCEPELEPEAFARSSAEAALIRLQQQSETFNVSLDALFSAYSQAAPIIATAVYELSLPKQARTVKIWQSGQAKPVNVAVQYRASKTFLLSEHSYLARLRDLPGKQANPNRGNPTQPNQAGSPAELELQNEWLPLQRLLQAEYRLYKASVTSKPTTQTELSGAKQTIDRDTALAKSAEQQQQWLEALEHWGKVVNSSAGLTRQQAQLAQANALTSMGEDYLAESLRRYLSLYADAGVAETAISQLSEQYRTQNNNAALQTLAAAMVLHRPGNAHTRLLLNALLKNGEYRFALLLGLSLGEQPPLEDLLTAAYRLEWWESYQHMQEQLPPAKRAFWQGLKAQHQGDYNAALKAWSTAELKPWRDYLQQGLQLREQLTQVTGQNAPELYRQWAQWQQQHPGAKTAQNGLWHVKDYAGGDSYYAVERDLYAQAVRATAQRPVVLSILGPATLNFQIRPLHPSKQPSSAVDGWLQIIDNNELYRYPFTNNMPAQGLILTGADDLQAGNIVNLLYQVGQGLHELRLSSEQAQLSIGIQELRPELALSVLPTLQADTLTEMAFLNRLHKAHNVNDPVF